MKTSKSCLCLVLLGLWCVISAHAQFSFRSGESSNSVVLIIKPDGTCSVTNLSTQPRSMIEMQLASWERFSKMSEPADSEDADPASAPAEAPKAAKPLSDEQLTAKIREMQGSMPGGREGFLVARVDVTSNIVQVVTSKSFASLKELLSTPAYAWSPTMLMYENARVEIDTNHNFRLTFTPNRQRAQFAKAMARQWKQSKMKSEWQLIAPGKILSSGLPKTEGTSTSFSFDSENAQSIEAATKLLETPLVITAEPAGLKLDEALDSNKLVQQSWRPNDSGVEVPITEAGPGFVAEAIGLTISSVHVFPEGQKYLSADAGSYMGNFANSSTGTVVSAKLFPPKGRTLRSVSDPVVNSARDDKERSLLCAPDPGSTEDENSVAGYTRFTSFGGGDSEQGGGPVQIELRLALPQPDAKAIDELEGQAVALTIGGWKEMTLTNVQADEKRQIDLGEVLPGAKLTIKKVSGKKPQTRIEATLDGGKDVRQLEIEIKSNNPRLGHRSNMNERQSKVSGDKVTRNLTIEAFDFGGGIPGGTSADSPVTLVVRFPQDVKRERVHFKLSGLDLL